MAKTIQRAGLRPRALIVSVTVGVSAQVVAVSFSMVEVEGQFDGDGQMPARVNRYSGASSDRVLAVGYLLIELQRGTVSGRMYSPSRSYACDRCFT